MTTTKDTLPLKTPAQLAAMFNELVIQLGYKLPEHQRASLQSQLAAVIAERQRRSPSP